MTTQYLWNQSAIDSLTQNNRLSEFGNPTVNSVMNTEQLQTWKNILNDEKMSFEKLVSFDLAMKKVIVTNIQKVKTKQKKVVKKKK